MNIQDIEVIIITGRKLRTGIRIKLLPQLKVGLPFLHQIFSASFPSL